MAKRPAPRRTVAPLPASRMPPGAVGATLASGQDGRSTAADDATDRQAHTEAQAEQVRRFLALMRERFTLSADAESNLRTNMRDDLVFYNGDQWPQHIKIARTLDQRPIITINRLPQFVRQVVNQARESKPAIQINPVDNGADPDTAEVIQGVMRNIERNSRAHIAYSTAIEHQAIMGRGFIRVMADWAADDAMEQEIKIKRIPDPLTVYPDPACVEPDYSDATFCILVEHIPTAQYKVRYPDARATGLSDFSSIGDQAKRWFTGKAVQVAEYYYVEEVKTKVHTVKMLLDGEQPTTVTLYDEAVRKIHKRYFDTGVVQVVKSRSTVRRQVKWAKTNGVEILDGNPERTGGKNVPGPFIPVVPVLGEELIVDGEKNLRGMVRDAKDPQRAYNFWVSAETEMIALAPRAPVIGADGQFDGHEPKWNQANTRSFTYLEYNAIDVNGTLVPAPQRTTFDPNLTGVIQATMQADRDLKSVLGMFDASQENSREQSGKAIIARQKQGETGTSHFLENVSRSIEHIGRILLHWIPVYYSQPRLMRIMGLDDQPREVVLHAGQKKAAGKVLQQAQQEGPNSPNARLARNILAARPFDVGVGRYDVTISVGPSFNSRRQESVEAMIQLVQAYPAVMPYIGDVLVENMDWPGARVIAQRLKRVLPPEVRDPEEGQPEIPPEVQQQMAEMSQQLDAALAALAEKEEIIQTKAQELAAKGQIEQLKIQSAERLRVLETEMELLKQKRDIQADTALALLDAKLDEIKLRLEHEHDKDMEEIRAENYVPPTSTPKAGLPAKTKSAGKGSTKPAAKAKKKVTA